MKKNVILFFLICGVLAGSLFSYQDYYDIIGNKVFNGQSLFEFGGNTSEAGGWKGSYGNNAVDWDRFLRDFGSQLSLYEKINNFDVQLTLGRTPAFFSPLTLNKTLYRWGYPSIHPWESFNGNKYYNDWQNDWGKWWEQRGIKLDLKDGDKEWTALLVKTADKGDDDEAEYRGDAKWQSENIDKDRYLLGFRHSFVFLNQKVGLSSVNQFDTLFKSSRKNLYERVRDNELFAGDASQTNSKVVYIKVSPDAPRRINSSASVFSIQTYVDDAYNPALSVKNGNMVGSANVSVSGTGFIKPDRVDVSGENNFVVYAFNVASYYSVSQMKSLIFHIDTANDYKIEVSSDGTTYRTVYRADGEVSDFANRKILYYKYTERSGASLLGFDMKGTIPYVGIDYSGEFSTSIQFVQSPGNQGAIEQLKNNAWYIETSKEIYPFLLVGKYHDINWNYYADFAVEDNDDRDGYPDVVDNYVQWKEGIDIDEKDGPDYDEDFLLFYSDRGFREGVDLNNNYAYDHEENDAQPDFPNKWRKGTAGWDLEMAYKPNNLFKAEAIYIDEKDNMGTAKNRTIYNKLLLTPSFPLADIVLKNELKRTWDDLPEDLVFNPNIPDPYADQRYENWQDPLNFKDNAVNNSYVTLSWKLLKHIELITRYNFGIDVRYYSGENVYSHLGIGRANLKDWYPFAKLGFLENLQAIPMIKFERSYKLGQTSSASMDMESWQQGSAGVMTITKLTTKTTLYIGAEYKVKNDFYDIDSLERNVFQIELNHTDQYWGRPLYITMGLKDIDQRSVANPPLKEIYTQYFLKAYFVW